MRSSANSQSQRHESRRGSALRNWLLRVVTLCVLALAAPGSAELIEELASALTGVDCCGDDCGEHEGPCSPVSCVHACCAHVNALVAVSLRVPAQPAPRHVMFDDATQRVRTSGVVVPPFRPPAV